MLAEQLVGEGRARRRERMQAREQILDFSAAGLFLAAAVALAIFLPSERELDPMLAIGLVVGYAWASRVRFEFGDTYLSLEQLVFVPMLLLLPLGLVPVLVAGAAVLAAVPDVARGNWHRDRLITPVSECLFSIAPVLVLAQFAPGLPNLAKVEVYLAALAAQVGSVWAWTVLHNAMVDHHSLRGLLKVYAVTDTVDAALAMVAFVITLSAVDNPAILLVMAPLAWLFHHFSQDRRERYSAALELHRAYRGTVMLLADVIEFEDGYTADHSRSVVDLTVAVAEEMGIDRESHPELEFAALLHDIGKITIPKDLLRKPTSLTEEEFALMKTHTVAGQAMLDRIGGLLGRVGEIVRSCHERWDGTGYPDGLAGKEIPLIARIVFACDAYNAMTTDRPYRLGMSADAALAELHWNAGTQFDPEVVDAVVAVVRTGEPQVTVSEPIRELLAGAPNLRQPIEVA